MYAYRHLPVQVKVLRQSGQLESGIVSLKGIVDVADVSTADDAHAVSCTRTCTTAVDVACASPRTHLTWPSHVEQGSAAAAAAQSAAAVAHAVARPTQTREVIARQRCVHDPAVACHAQIAINLSMT